MSSFESPGCRNIPQVVLLLVALLMLFGCGAGGEQLPVNGGGGLRLGAVLGEIDQDAYERADPDYRFIFPADHGPHQGFRSEWWYLTLVLTGEDGEDYGGQFTLFRQALLPPTEFAARTDDNEWNQPQLYMAHLAVADVARRQHLDAERFSRAHPSLAGVRGEPFAAWIDDWRLSSQGSADLFPLVLEAGTEAFHWSLRLTSDRPPALQGDAGYSAKGPGQASHYYSYTRLEVSGALRLGDRDIAVRGSGWLDREWSTSVLGTAQTGWDWFALQLDDGRDLMAFRLRRSDCRRDVYDHGLLVEPDSSTQRLGPERFELIPKRWWRPPEHRWVSACAGEGAGYPVEWRLRLDDEVFDVRAAFEDQRMQTAVRYWEGLVHVSKDDERVGRGYLEMTGYEGGQSENKQGVNKDGG